MTYGADVSEWSCCGGYHFGTCTRTGLLWRLAFTNKKSGSKENMSRAFMGPSYDNSTRLIQDMARDYADTSRALSFTICNLKLELRVYPCDCICSSASCLLLFHQGVQFLILMAKRLCSRVDMYVCLELCHGYSSVQCGFKDGLSPSQRQDVRRTSTAFPLTSTHIYAD